jgi:hypothetical protein
MNRIIFLILVFLLAQTAKGQQQSDISDFFNEVKTITKKNKNLWNKDLYGAMFFIDPQTRQLFANEPDTVGFLKPAGNIYTGILPENINFANTAIDWNGKRWTMIMLPIAEDKYKRINLSAHELFHKAQPSLGFILKDAANNHLDDKAGRIYLRLELEALKKATQSSSKKEIQQHLTHALTFRKYRNLLYPGSDTTENLLELNEGMAEFTGLIISGRNKNRVAEYFANGINTFFENPTFIRSFAYYTTPAYGYLLYGKSKNWNKEITMNTNLANYFIKAFNINLPTNLKKTVEIISGNYNEKIIVGEETAREEKNKKIIADYKHKFIDSPHFELRFEKMNISFDPRNIVPLEDKGTVYPNIKVTDLWGILSVDDGALMSSNWDKITITHPIKIENKKIIGAGWTLELADNYSIEKDETNGNYKLIKK